MRLTLVLVLTAVALAPWSARATDDLACWYRDIEQLDATLNPPQAGDNSFFTASDVPPNLLWVLDNSGSMRAQPCASGNGCSEYRQCDGGFQAYGNDYFTSRGYPGYTSDATALDAFDPDFCSTPGDARAFSGKDGCYKPGLVYRGMGCGGWPSDGQVWDRDGSSDSAATIVNWCFDNYNSYPANPATSPSSCDADADCPTGYTCRSEDGGGGSRSCYLRTLDCTTAGYVCPATYTCNAATGNCESSTITVTPPNPYDPYDSCSGDWECDYKTGGGYICVRSDGSVGWGQEHCRLAYGNAWRFPYDDCDDGGYSCPGGYTCNSSSGECETTATGLAPLEEEGSDWRCDDDSECGAGYVCITDGGGTSGNGRRCRLPLAGCATTACPSGYSCDALTNACVSSDALACITNLRTYGYHDGGSREDPVFTGDLLNFSPPKFVIARKVLKDLVPEVKKTRQALITFDSDNSYGKVRTHLGPTCDKFLSPGGQPISPSDTDFAAQADEILEDIDNVEFDTNTPLSETLAMTCQYITSNQSRWYYDVKVKGQNGVRGYDSELASRSGDNDSTCFTCQKNFVVIITDGLPTEDSGAPSRIRNYGGTNSSSYLDDVANFCHTEDLRPDLSGVQNATTHTIAFGIQTPILEDAAALGGGVHIAADDANQLRNAVAQVVADVNSRATSFSVASVTTVQTKGTTYAFVPRFRPFAEDLWEGHLYRFKLFNEFAAGCTSGDTAAPFTADKLAVNLNADGDCSDVYLLDGNDDVVQEDPDGRYLVADTSQDWDEEEGWPLKSPPEPAVPVWDAAQMLQNRNPNADPRVIYTVVDTNANGVLEPSEQIEFNVTNVGSIMPWLSLGGADGPTCTAIAKRKKMTSVHASEQHCALDVMRFVRGLDVFDEDKDHITNEARPRMLGDIFHSSPILVTAPTPGFFCNLGLNTQCLPSLYGPQLTPGGEAAYNTWVETQEKRTQVVLVGANDGMVHAFHAGDWATGDDPDTPIEEADHLTLGTGRELWAFIPPDLLPKLKRLFNRDGRHEIFVDGTAMVRDVWVDETNAGQKDAGEFHTMAVIGERQGGRHYLALDITTPETPAFRWTWPPPGTGTALEAGESWSDFAPAPPPIGPVAIADVDGPLARGADTFREQWVVGLGGGYDPTWRRGRSVQLLDVWTGNPVWRFAASQASGTSDPRSHLAPVAATVSLLDLGPSSTSRGVPDGLFDSMVFSDILGQVWTAHFHDPGVDDNSDGQADNWYAARAFVQHEGDALAKRSPFFSLAEVSIDPQSGVVRAHLGSGDRANIRDLEGGTCGLVNLNACMRKGCDLTINSGSVAQGDVSHSSVFTHAPGATAFTNTLHVVDDDTAGYACGDLTTASLSVSVTCGSGTTASTGTWDWSLACDWSDVDGSLCNEVPKPHPYFSSVNYAASTENARFYTFRLFDDVRTPFSTQSEAQAYDQAALTDGELADADATSPTVDEDGFYVPYTRQDERTASAASVLGGYVYWNTLKPDTTTRACGSKVEDEARLYNAHYSSGVAKDPVARSTVRKAIVPPPPPTPVVSFNPKSGQVHYSMVAVEPGVAPSQVDVGTGDPVGNLYWLEIPRELHECRHGTGSCD